MWESVSVFKEVVNGVTYELLIGNCYFELEDHFDDKETINHIRSELETQNVYAWFDAEVKASVHEVSESTYLGCCSYKDLGEFLRDQYYEDMKADALDMLNEKMKELKEVIDSYLETLDVEDKNL